MRVLSSSSSSSTQLMMIAVVIFVSIFVIFSPTTNFASALPLKKYPALQCSMCKAVVEVIGDKMNETAAKKQTILKSHRLEGGNVGDRRIDYEASELRGYEILEKLCDQNNFGSYMMREERRTGLRIFSREGALQQCMPYDDTDRKDLHDTMTSKFIHKACEELVEEHEEHIVGLIKSLRTFDELSDAFCKTKTRLCTGKRYDKGVKEDLARRAAWRKRTGIRTGTDVDNEKELEEEKKKKEQAEQAEQQQQQQVPTSIQTPGGDGQDTLNSNNQPEPGTITPPVVESSPDL